MIYDHMITMSRRIICLRIKIIYAVIRWWCLQRLCLLHKTNYLWWYTYVYVLGKPYCGIRSLALWFPVEPVISGDCKNLMTSACNCQLSWEAAINPTYQPAEGRVGSGQVAVHENNAACFLGPSQLTKCFARISGSVFREQLNLEKYWFTDKSTLISIRVEVPTDK